MPLQDQALADVIRDFRGGKDRERNFRLLFLRFYAQVCRYFQSKGIPAEDSQDLAQDVFCQVFKGLDHVRDGDHFVGWMFTICRNVFNNEIERRHARKRAGSAHTAREGDRTEAGTLETASPAPNAMKRLLDKEKVSALGAELRKLPEQMRRCVYLRVVHEHSDEEIATLLGISASTVRVHVHRARKSLTETLSPLFGDLRIG